MVGYKLLQVRVEWLVNEVGIVLFGLTVAVANAGITMHRDFLDYRPGDFDRLLAVSRSLVDRLPYRGAAVPAARNPPYTSIGRCVAPDSATAWITSSVRRASSPLVRGGSSPLTTRQKCRICST